MVDCLYVICKFANFCLQKQYELSNWYFPISLFLWSTGTFQTPVSQILLLFLLLTPFFWSIAVLVRECVGDDTYGGELTQTHHEKPVLFSFSCELDGSKIMMIREYIVNRRRVLVDLTQSFNAILTAAGQRIANEGTEQSLSTNMVTFFVMGVSMDHLIGYMQVTDSSSFVDESG